MVDDDMMEVVVDDLQQRGTWLLSWGFGRFDITFFSTKNKKIKTLLLNLLEESCENVTLVRNLLVQLLIKITEEIINFLEDVADHKNIIKVEKKSMSVSVTFVRNLSILQLQRRHI